MTKATRRQTPDERAAKPSDPELMDQQFHALAVSHPPPTNLGETVIQYSPSVTTPFQNPPHNKRTIKSQKPQPQNTHNTKRKRPNNLTLDREATGTNSAPESQHNTDNLNNTQAPKRPKKTQPDSPLTTTLLKRTPTSNPPHQQTPKQYRHGHNLDPNTRPHAKHTATSTLPTISHLQQPRHHTTSQEI